MHRPGSSANLSPRQTCIALAGLLIIMNTSASCSDENSYAADRAALVAEIEMRVRETRSYLGKSELDPRVMKAVAKVPRHEFVPPALGVRGV